MNYSKRPIIAVVTALANGFTEKELLRGIISENMKNGCATAVFSNIYNIVQKNEDLLAEQRIYELAKSKQISGIILLAESFVEENIRRGIASLLKDVNVPMVSVGTRLDEFRNLRSALLNTSDTADLEALTSHLIEEHSFTDIALLTGMKEIETSRLRVEGYMNALRSHGIEPDPEKVFYGNFWLTSGDELACRYINGELPLPQAVICANDMMAYGMLRTFIGSSIRVPEDITVVSYEYSDMRRYYTPLLTSFHRDHEGLGRAAAQQLHSLISGSEPPEFIPPKGRFVFGDSCTCKCDDDYSLSELRAAERRRLYNDLSLFSTMEQKLTLCRDMEEFVHIIGDHHWLIQNKKNIFLTLASDWYDSRSESSEVMFARSILYWGGSNIIETERLDIRNYFELEPDSAVCYFSPLFSGKKTFGYMVLLYDSPESYDDVYRHWLKSVSIGLEFLRLKNDIRYLLSCQNVSEYRDTLTGLNNEKGLKRAYQAVRIHDNRNLYLVMLRVNLFPQQMNDEEIRRKTNAVFGVGRAISKYCGNHDISGRISDDVFCCLVQSSAGAEMVADLLESVLIQERSYMEYAGMSSFACCAIPCSGEDFDELLSRCFVLIEKEHLAIANRRKNRYYSSMLSVRNRIYLSTELTFEPDCENMFTDRADFFRRNYKSCFGAAFHQDCISARIAKAKYYLATTSLSITEISEKCGYIDNKYFQRQFVQSAGIPAMQYRNLMKG